MRPGHDGVTRVLYRLIKHLTDRNLENIFFSPIIPSPAESPTKMFEVPSVTFPLYKDYRFAMPGLRHFERDLREFQPDILHINSPCPLGAAAVKYGQRHQVPVVATYHTHFASYAKYYKVKAFEAASWSYLRSLYNGCQKVYVPSLPILSELELHGIQNLDFLPHGVDTEAFHPRFRSRKWRAGVGAKGKHVLLYVGRLVWEKDLQTFIESYKLLKSQRDDAVFVLAGDGPIRQTLEEAMPDAVFLGHLSGTELATAYASSDLFVFPSTTETFGNVTVEAMASAVPPICARAGGAAGIIEHGRTGLLAKPRDPVDLVAQITTLLDDPDRREIMRLESLAFAQKQRWEFIFDRMLASYDDIVQNFKSSMILRRKKAA
jgi:glycosyltransferase involved in cell wall biosynthesis